VDFEEDGGARSGEPLDLSSDRGTRRGVAMNTYIDFNH
jgi:hypothetical protein